MNWEIPILLVVAAGVSGAIHQASTHHLRPTHNSTFLTDNTQLFKPIIIPNITKYAEHSQTTKTTEPDKAKETREQTLHPQKPPPSAEKYSDDKSRINENSLKFSSRYSTEKMDRGSTENLEERVGATEVPDSFEGSGSEPGSGRSQQVAERNSFSVRPDDLDSSEEEEDVRKYFDINEPEESEVAPPTNEPYQDIPKTTSFRSTRYPEEDFKNYEITSPLTTEKDNSEEEEAEEKRSVADYYNLGSKNYHSVQTPLSKIQYRGPQSFQDDFDSERVRTRLVSPIRRPSSSHNWPYSRSRIKTEAEEVNEISETDDGSLEEGIRKELKGKPKILGLELAVKKDETKFDQNTKYNYIKERNRGKEKLKSLSAEEDEDHRGLPYQTLKQYQVDEEPRYQPPKKIPPKPKEILPSKSPLNNPPKKILWDKPQQSTRATEELAPKLQTHQFLGPVVFNHNLGHDKAKAATKAHPTNDSKAPIWNAVPTALQEREKLDQNSLTDQKIHKLTVGTGSLDYRAQSFNHLEESEEMYNAILANIQSVFGLKTQPSKSPTSRTSGLESRILTWSVPLIKRS